MSESLWVWFLTVYAVVQLGDLFLVHRAFLRAESGMARWIWLLSTKVLLFALIWSYFATMMTEPGRVPLFYVSGA